MSQSSSVSRRGLVSASLLALAVSARPLDGDGTKSEAPIPPPSPNPSLHSRPPSIHDYTPDSSHIGELSEDGSGSWVSSAIKETSAKASQVVVSVAGQASLMLVENVSRRISRPVEGYPNVVHEEFVSDDDQHLLLYNEDDIMGTPKLRKLSIHSDGEKTTQEDKGISPIQGADAEPKPSSPLTMPVLILSCTVAVLFFAIVVACASIADILYNHLWKRTAASTSATFWRSLREGKEVALPSGRVISLDTEKAVLPATSPVAGSPQIEKDQVINTIQEKLAVVDGMAESIAPPAYCEARPQAPSPASFALPSEMTSVQPDAATQLAGQLPIFWLGFHQYGGAFVVQFVVVMFGWLGLLFGAGESPMDIRT